MKPSEQRVYKYLQTHKFLTVNDCKEILGTTELRKIVSDLRIKLISEGCTIDDVWTTSVNRYGDKVRYKRYFLKKIENSC
jgi:hypothetical protein